MRLLASAVAVAAVLGPLAGTCVARDDGGGVAAESRMVTVRDVTTRPGAISGVLVNRSQQALRDVRLMIHHVWHWADERHPGDDSPGRVDYFTVRSELPAGGTVDFTYRPEPPLPERGDGHFETTVDVVGWTEVTRSVEYGH